MPLLLPPFVVDSECTGGAEVCENYLPNFVENGVLRFVRITRRSSVRITCRTLCDFATSKTDGIFAIEAVSILAPHYYENRHELWSAISGISPSESEYLVAEALKQQALSNDLPWDDNQIQKMSKGIVAGFYKWNLENPGDL